MGKCPLCGGQAIIEPPEWSEARMLVDCPKCGKYQTNNLTIVELNELRSKNSPRIKELQYTIEVNDDLLHITKSQRFEGIVLESGPSRELTKRQKKNRRRGTSVEVIGSLYKGDEPEKKPE